MKLPRVFWCLAAFVLAGVIGRSAPLVATNPIIPGFNPDPSICRVGEDFYLVTSSFEYFPGVPVYHSRDLVNWKLIGHALHTPEALNLDGIESSGGIYAPTIRHHDGTFYMITTLVGAKGRPGGNFIVTAKNAAGPWSNPVWIKDAPGIDPSLFFDQDGRLYYCGNGRPEKQVHDKHRIIWVQELDRATLQLKGPRTVLESAEFFANGQLGPVNNFEAPHLYRRGDWYYLIVSHGGTGQQHAVSVWRSRQPLGPWEINPANPILTHRDAKDSPVGITCTGHADFTDAPDGSWWAVLLAVRSDYRNSAMGRESFLARLTWENDWPVINAHEQRGRVRFAVEAPAFARTVPPAPDTRVFRDEFTGEELGLDWTFLRTPRERWWDLKTAPGTLRVALRPEEITEIVQPSFLGVRITSARTEATTSVNFVPRGPQDAAGLTVQRAREAAYSLLIEQAGDGRVATAYLGREKLGSVAVAAQGAVQLRARLLGKKLTLLAQDAAGAWQEVVTVDATPLYDAQGGRFTGTFAGVYATSRGQPGGSHADFEWFELRPVP
jgi:alpha-N-arabinofuranosidase